MIEALRSGAASDSAGPFAEAAEAATPAASRGTRDQHGRTDPAAANAFAATLATLLGVTPGAPADRKAGQEAGFESELGGDAAPAGAGRGAAELVASGEPIGAGNAAAAMPPGSGADWGRRPAATDAERATVPNAFDAAAAVRGAAAASPGGVPNTNPEALNPEFRVRLGRVITRMREEFGYDVRVTEGFRPQARQNLLYEQGRTQPGQVVTWTRSSKHTLGLAADLQIDGSYDNTAAYARLAQLASQQGLRTLGARDPGHVELASRSGTAGWGDAAAPAVASGVPGARLDAGITRAVDLLAQATGGAQSTAFEQSGGDVFNGLLRRMTSRVGQPTDAVRGRLAASHGIIAAGPRDGPTAATMTDSTGTTVSAGRDGGAQGRSLRSGPGAEERRGDGDLAHRAAPAAPGAVAEIAAVAPVAAVAGIAEVAEVARVAGAASVAAQVHRTPAAGEQGAAGAASAAGTAAGAGAAERVGRILDVRDATPAQPLSRLTLALGDQSGGKDHITVNVRAGAVSAAIATADPAGADRLSLRVGALQRALEQHGLQAAIRVDTTSSDTGAGWTPRPGSDTSSREERQSPHYRDSSRQDADGARHRSRREQQGGTR